MDKNDAIAGHITSILKESRNEGLILSADTNPEFARPLALLLLKKCLKYADVKPTSNNLDMLWEIEREADRGRCRNTGFFDTQADKEEIYHMSINTSVHRALERMNPESHNECPPGYFRVLAEKK